MPQQPDDTSMDLADYDDVLQESEQVLRQCFKQFKRDEIFLSFNGGKDCTVLLDIAVNVLKELYGEEAVGSSLKVVYIRTNGPFREIEDFIKEVEEHYGMKLMVVTGEMKETLEKILEQDGRLKACLMGTRRTDPYCNDLQFMQRTDPSWPPVIRVSPLLNWSYHQIWSYILQRHVPYCCLYNKGYTSIGSIQNTWPNPSLEYKDSSGCVSYHPAWRLVEGSLERAGRGTNPHAATNGHKTTEKEETNGCLDSSEVE